MTESIEKSVWTLWTKPFSMHFKSDWTSKKHHLLAWVLSVETARKHYPETTLFTDDEGAYMLLDGIGLEFEHTSTELNFLRMRDPEWWTLGKLYAYRAQTAPFIHLDTDVFLWKALPDRVVSASVFAQNPEYFPFGGETWYRPQVYDAALKAANGWLPVEWNWYISHCGGRALCCGILGGNRVDFINHYANMAIRIIEHPRNQCVWSFMDNKIGDNILFEQYYLSACIEYHRGRETSEYHDINTQYLFDSPEEAFKPDKAREAGYTHLIGGAKQDANAARRLEQRVARDYPAHYERCIQYLSEISNNE